MEHHSQLYKPDQPEVIASIHNPTKGHPIILKWPVLLQFFLSTKMQIRLPAAIELKMEKRTVLKDDEHYESTMVKCSMLK